MSEFEQITSNLLDELKELSISTFGNLGKKAFKENKVFFNKTRNDIEIWTKQYIAELITKEELEFLIKSKKDLLELKSLTRKGLSHIKIEGYKEKVINLLLSKISKIL